MDFYRKDFGKKLQRRMEEMGFSNQEDFARAIGPKLDRSRISIWTTGKSFPEPDHFEKICELLKIEPSYFLSSEAPSAMTILAYIKRLEADVKRLNKEVRKLEMSQVDTSKDKRDLIALIVGLDDDIIAKATDLILGMDSRVGASNKSKHGAGLIKRK